MKKTVLIIVLAVLVLFCLISIAVGGFFGWRFYQKHRMTQASIKTTVEKQLSETVPNQEENEPQVQSEQGQPEQAQPQEAPQAEAPAEPTQSDSGMTPQTTAPDEAASPESEETTQEAEAEPVPTREPQRKRAPARPSPAAAPAPAPSPEPAPASQPQHETAAAPQAPAEAAPQTAVTERRKKEPRGTLGLIFESKLDQGEVIIHVDGKVVVAKAFTASPENRFRLTKGLRLVPGQHRVKVKVAMPDGKNEIKEWTVMVVKGGDTVWKIEMKRFPRTLDVKPIT